MDLNVDSFQNWSPIRFYVERGEAFVDWIFVGEERFTKPFHDDTINLLLQKPFNLLFRRQTPISFLGEIYETHRGIKPNGFIFHISRCGSTLVSQMLASLDKNIVISEASITDKVIRADSFFGGVSESQKIIWLRWIFSTLAQKRFSAEENFFVKFDSWSVLDLPLIEKAFPDVPWIFMYRQPLEVIVSNLRQPGAQMIPGAINAIFPQMNLLEILQFSTEERFARTIAKFCEAALSNAESPNAKFINYQQLPDAFAAEICPHFKLNFDVDESERMRNSAKFHAKNPSAKFAPDSEEKRTGASDATIHFAETLVAPFYEKLERIRTNPDAQI